jgi:riboflavin synthase
MFTGIIEETGQVTDVAGDGAFRTIHVRVGRVLDDIRPGSSVAVNGVCLTARTIGPSGFTAELSRETLDRTTLGELKTGSAVNIERPMRGDSRFGGHIVQGHVDGVGRIRHFERRGDDWDLQVEFPASGARYLVEKGSIAVDGISLTIASLPQPDVFSVAIIPHTFDNTNLKGAQAGDPVNLEFDVIAKYVEKMTGPFAR